MALLWRGNVVADETVVWNDDDDDEMMILLPPPASTSDLRQAARWARTLNWWMERWEILCSDRLLWSGNDAHFIDWHRIHLKLCWSVICAVCFSLERWIFLNVLQSWSTKRWWILRRERRMALWRDNLHLQVLSVHNPNRSVSEFTSISLEFSPVQTQTHRVVVSVSCILWIVVQWRDLVSFFLLFDCS